MTTTPLAFLRATHTAAQAEAEAASIETGAPGWHGDDSGLYSDDASRHPGPFLADTYGYTEPKLIAYIARHDPAATLRRIAADRKLIEDLARIIGGDYIDDGELPLAEHVLQLIAEGWGWTEGET